MYNMQRADYRASRIRIDCQPQEKVRHKATGRQPRPFLLFDANGHAVSAVAMTKSEARALLKKQGS